MTYSLRIERLIDAPPDVVFDAFVDPAAQKVLYDDEAEPTWTVESELDLRVGGTWIIAFGKAGEEPYGETNVFTEIDRPRRVVFDSVMAMGEEGRRKRDRDFSTRVTVTFEERGAKTLLTIVQSGFEHRDDRDGVEGGWGSIINALERASSPSGSRGDVKVLLVNNPSPVPGGPEVVEAETERLLGAAGHHPALFRSVPRETVPSPLSRLR